jgi:hypothetical protein
MADWEERKAERGNGRAIRNQKSATGWWAEYFALYCGNKIVIRHSEIGNRREPRHPGCHKTAI